MSKRISILILIASLFLVACQPVSDLNSTNNSNQQNNENKPPVEEVVPVLKTVLNNQPGEFKLRSQTAHFLKSDKSSVEIILSNTYSAFCAKPSPTLGNDEQQITLTIKSNNGKTALTKGEMVGNATLELSKKTSAGEVKLDPKLITSLKITDLNNAIIRGSLSSSNSTDGKIEGLEGEFFAAICK